MSSIPPGLGNSLLILMSDTPASLTMIREVVRQLVDPTHTTITLAYYLEPMLWLPVNQDTLKNWHDVFDQEAKLLEKSPPNTSSYFDRACRTLSQAGVKPEQIRVETLWRDPETISLRLMHLKRGTYSGVVIVRHHYDLVFSLLGITLRRALDQYGHQVTVWIFNRDSPTP
jgi:hypothetical protein